MSTATLTAKGQIVIPADIRRRYDLRPGTQVQFVDDNGSIVLRVVRRVEPSNPDDGFGLIKVDPARKAGRKLSEFDPASLTTDRKP